MSHRVAFLDSPVATIPTVDELKDAIQKAMDAGKVIGEGGFGFWITDDQLEFGPTCCPIGAYVFSKYVLDPKWDERRKERSYGLRDLNSATVCMPRTPDLWIHGFTSGFDCMPLHASLGETESHRLLYLRAYGEGYLIRQWVREKQGFIGAVGGEE